MYGSKYSADFKENVKTALEAEEIAMELVSQIVPEANFISVRDLSEYHHIGDFMDTKTANCYEVKEDSVIHRTHNVFVEDMKFWNNGYVSKGWMHSKYENLVVLDSVCKNIYVLDFKGLIELCNGARHVSTFMGDNETTGYLVPLRKCRQFGVLLQEKGYTYDEVLDCYKVA